MVRSLRATWDHRIILLQVQRGLAAGSRTGTLHLGCDALVAAADGEVGHARDRLWNFGVGRRDWRVWQVRWPLQRLVWDHWVCRWLLTLVSLYNTRISNSRPIIIIDKTRISSQLARLIPPAVVWTATRLHWLAGRLAETLLRLLLLPGGLGWFIRAAGFQRVCWRFLPD